MLTGSVGWKVWDNMVVLSSIVNLGIAVYAAGASLVEVSARMAFYAIEQRKRERERIRREARQEGTARRQTRG